MTDLETTLSDGGEDLLHFLGEYEIPDAKRLVGALEDAGIPYDIQRHDGTAGAGMRGSMGWLMTVSLWIDRADQARAEAVQAATFKIQT
ncbi:MAG TPA: hypothetical protein PK636_01700 [bacterium]|nr:hypothetical protein [bacterium]HPJ71379.1 hypothetical protein [bacterium]HPQ66437.1 hypothetical protein [bacterium]